MTESLARSSFVAPHFIPALGEEGLTLHEVAQSLQIKFSHAKEVYEKNISDYSGAEISAPTGNPVNPYVQSYALTTEDAKFFVAGYNNDIGKAYRRYLIQCEKAVQKLAQQVRQITPGSEAEEIMGVWTRVGALMKVPEHLAIIEAAKEARRRTGVDFTPLLQLSPTQEAIPDEDEMLEPTELAERLGISRPATMNRKLAELGLQVREGRSWVPTPAGASMCVRHAWVTKDKSGYNLKWSLLKVKACYAQYQQALADDELAY